MLKKLKKLAILLHFYSNAVSKVKSDFLSFHFIRKEVLDGEDHWMGWDNGCVSTFVLIGGIYGFQVSTASGDLIEVSKRQDYATDDKTFHTNEDIYIKIGKDKVGKFRRKGQLQVLVKQKVKSGQRKESVPLVIQGDKTAVSYRRHPAAL